MKEKLRMVIISILILIFNFFSSKYESWILSYSHWPSFRQKKKFSRSSLACSSNLSVCKKNFFFATIGTYLMVPFAALKISSASFLHLHHLLNICLQSPLIFPDSMLALEEQSVLAIKVLINDLFFVWRLKVVTGSFVLVDVEVKRSNISCFNGGLQTSITSRIWTFLFICFVSF